MFSPFRVEYSQGYRSAPSQRCFSRILFHLILFFLVSNPHIVTPAPSAQKYAESADISLHFKHPSHSEVVFSPKKITGNFSVVRFARICYLIDAQGKKHMFPDRYTLNTYGFHYNTLSFLSRAEIDAIPDGGDVPTLWDHHSNAEMLSIAKYSQPFLLDTFVVLKNLLNPDIVYFNGDIVLSYRHDPGTIRIVWIKKNAVNPPISTPSSPPPPPVQSSKVSHDIDADLAILSKIDFRDSNMGHPFLEFKGEDPRVFVTEGHSPTLARLWVFFCKRYKRGKPEIQMSQVRLVLEGNNIKIAEEMDINFNNVRPNEDQKNWSPLEIPVDRPGEVEILPINAVPGQNIKSPNGFLLIATPDPYHRIVETFLPNKRKPTYGEAKVLATTRIVGVRSSTNSSVAAGPSVISKPALGHGHAHLQIRKHHGQAMNVTASTPSSPTSPFSHLQKLSNTLNSIITPATYWDYGEMRGGTQAVKIDDNTFLTFFHSSRHPPETGYVLKTYVMGAYTFDSKPPFAIKTISTHPIVHDSMYTGPWSNLPESYYHMDYIIFPMGFLIKGDVIYLFYGKQDKEGWVAKINLPKLLASLKPVTSMAINKG